ncbi:uncharacterized protein LOC126370975 [Pectinophora gossypiella]|uniref:uncharacterized protein LOC126370975 n=1 Tax=Pectinophora gossypiella TaxID=13191 RepID=UPI00214EDADF|nr:uncharacterized protein LOC126370975 [Pectinophora gossypiella]XP_049872108.1 uncharacterized protein LOC126370975 [Pectinophora gossypiella]
MPKRKYDGKKEDKWRRKIRKYEQKLNRENRHRCTDDEVYLESDGRASVWSSPDRSPASATAAVVAMAEGISAASATPIVTPGNLAPSALPSPVPPELSTTGGRPLQPTDPTLMLTPREADANDNSEALVADPELLKALGDYETETAEWGPDIVADLAKRWDPILRDGLKKESREKLIKGYLLPKNCPLTKAPVLNPEIAAVLNESARNRDARVQRKQSQIGCVLAILGKTMSGILTKSSDTSEILRLLTDATKLLSDSHHLETETRRFLVTPMVDKTFIEPFKDRKRDCHLFGEKLGEFIKSSRGIQNTGKLIQSAASASTLNYKGPPSRQQYHRSARAQSRRGGGNKPISNYRRRGAAQTPGTSRAPNVATHHPPAVPRHKQAGAATTANTKQ